jgi:hypothetical protein
MKKILRRLLILVLVLLVVAVAPSMFAWKWAHTVPTWYPRTTADPVARAAAANQMDQKLIAMYRDARESARESEIRSLHAASGAPPATAPSGLVKIELTEEEINAFLAKWEQKFGWKERVSSFLTDPVIVLEDNEIILAGTVKEWDTLMSLHFEVGLEKDGKLSLKLARVMAGTLPLPRSYFNGYTQKLVNAISNKVSQMRSEADIDASGCANGPAVSLAMAELLEHSLQDEPSDPVLFLPERIGHNSRSLPVNVTGVSIANKTLSLTLEPMTVEQREALLHHLRGPADTTETAMGRPVH